MPPPPQALWLSWLATEAVAAAVFTLVLIGVGAALQFSFFLANSFALVGVGWGRCGSMWQEQSRVGHSTAVQFSFFLANLCSGECSWLGRGVGRGAVMGERLTPEGACMLGWTPALGHCTPNPEVHGSPLCCVTSSLLQVFVLFFLFQLAMISVSLLLSTFISRQGALSSASGIVPWCRHPEGRDCRTLRDCHTPPTSVTINYVTGAGLPAR